MDEQLRKHCEEILDYIFEGGDLIVRTVNYSDVMYYLSRRFAVVNAEIIRDAEAERDSLGKS